MSKLTWKLQGYYYYVPCTLGTTLRPGSKDN
jgi:hypothetical protein